MGPRTIEIQEAVLGKNDEIAARCRAAYRARGLLVVNVMSSPGSGKTAFLERTLADLAAEIPMGVIVGDIATDNDARRLSGKGASIVQVTTGGYCHLDAGMVEAALEAVDLPGPGVLFIENVGNLVCPATFDLGEDLCIALISVTEGEDKPLKYPTLFRKADAIVVNKVDIAEAVDWDREAGLGCLRGIASRSPLFEVSARTGQGMAAWYAYLKDAYDRR